jgi:hypothetical protein
LLPLAGWLPNTIVKPIAGLILTVANYAGILAGILFLISLFRVDFATRRATRLPLIVTCMVISIVIATLAEKFAACVASIG